MRLGIGGWGLVVCLQLRINLIPNLRPPTPNLLPDKQFLGIP